MVLGGVRVDNLPAAGDLTFEVDAALLFELGEKLVARKSVALAELIKNAYDADATQVIVRFEHVAGSDGVITVEDNGAGMTFETVRAHWMRIATTNKVLEPVTPKFHRVKTGAKGVGRFAARRLARYLTIRAIAKTEDGLLEVTTVDFDWDAFRPGETLGSVRVRYQRLQASPKDTTGVSLQMRGTRDIWARTDIEEIREDLQDLTPPFASSVLSALDPTDATSRFVIRIEAPEFPEFEGTLTAQFLSAAVARLVGEIDDSGAARYGLRIRGEGRDREFQAPDLRMESLPGAKLEIHYFKYDRQALSETGWSLVGARAMGTRFGGVKIYLDGFRVFPYGDVGDDWLGLDADRGRRLTAIDEIVRQTIPADLRSRPMLALPGNNNLFGAVLVSRTVHPGLQPTLSRERLLATESFAELYRFARTGINWMVVQRADFENRRRPKRERPEPSETVGSAPFASRMTAEITSLRSILTKLDTRETADVAAELDQIAQAIQAHEEKELDKVAVLRILASAGTMILVFVHQMRAALDGLRRISAEASREQGAGPAKERLSQWTDMLDAQASELGMLLGTASRASSHSIAVSPVVEQVLATFQGYADDHGIGLENVVKPGVRTPPMRDAELHSVLLNLISNSLKAVKGTQARRIQVDARRTEKDFRLTVSDTGFGISPDRREEAFEPFVTTSAPDPVLGVGTGLGLTIVRDIAEEHDGTARFADPPDPWGSRVVVTFPVGVSE